MHTYVFSQLSEEIIRTLVTLNEKSIAPEAWEKMQILLTTEESRRLDDIKSTLRQREFNPEQEIFGCYTVNDSWAFIRGVVSDIETDKPTFTLEFSPVYNGIWDAEQIVQLLKFIVAKHLEEINNG